MRVNKKFGKTTCQGSLKWLELGEVARSRHCSRLASEISFMRCIVVTYLHVSELGFEMIKSLSDYSKIGAALISHRHN